MTTYNPNATPLDELIAAWKSALEDDNRRPTGIRRYIDQVKDLAKTLGAGADLAAITTPAIKHHKHIMRERGASGATIGNALSAIRCFVRWLVEEGYLESDPTQKVRWPKREDPDIRWLQKADLVRLDELLIMPEGLSDTQVFYWQRAQRAIYLMRHAGLRISEVAALRRRDLELASERPVVFVARGKNGRNRKIAMNQTLHKVLAPLDDWDPDAHVVGLQVKNKKMDPKSLAHIFERWLARRGMVISAHQLRRAFATDLKRNGVDISTIQGLLGHRSLETTQRYLEGDDDMDHDAVRRLDR